MTSRGEKKFIPRIQAFVIRDDVDSVLVDLSIHPDLGFESPLDPNFPVVETADHRCWSFERKIAESVIVEGLRDCRDVRCCVSLELYFPEVGSVVHLGRHVGPLVFSGQYVYFFDPGIFIFDGASDPTSGVSWPGRPSQSG